MNSRFVAALFFACVLAAERHSVLAQEPTPTASPSSAPAPPTPSPAGVQTPGDGETAPAEVSVPPEQGMELTGQANPQTQDLFAKIDIPVNDSGGASTQIVRLNEKVIESGGMRYSGFRFVVDRSQAAAKQSVERKEELAFYWYFVPPKPMTDWYICAAEGGMKGFERFTPLKLWRFKGWWKLRPQQKDRLIVQSLAAGRLKDGKEYVMWFGFPVADKDPVEMSLAIGYSKAGWDLRNWKGVGKTCEFLGLTHRGPLNGGDAFRR